MLINHVSYRYILSLTQQVDHLILKVPQGRSTPGVTLHHNSNYRGFYGVCGVYAVCGSQIEIMFLLFMS